jgi:hypothetical protein
LLSVQGEPTNCHSCTGIAATRFSLLTIQTKNLLYLIYFGSPFVDPQAWQRQLLAKQAVALSACQLWWQPYLLLAWLDWHTTITMWSRQL